ncbi:hypothetical protein FE257_002399 [Aspergillus nanangensis]|uniref:Uncharacterized protein n=1 Tax=Aspergillus nanangensis TaxID=2582783 RepID=A0AAD4CCN1_ASPNN|nr:hypothetical protein FE257_002399 [Aspergillus nanangensis]
MEYGTPNRNLVPNSRSADETKGSLLSLGKDSASQLLPTLSDPPYTTKVPIARVSQSTVPSSARRTRKACVPCREHKTKCNGILQELEDRVDAYEDMLQRLRPKVDDHDRELITGLLDRYNSVRLSPFETDDPVAYPTDLSSVGADYVEEDYNRDKRLQAFGFVGGPSEMSWIQDLKKEIKRTTSHSQPTPSEPLVSDNTARDLTSTKTYTFTIGLNGPLQINF